MLLLRTMDRLGDVLKSNKKELGAVGATVYATKEFLQGLSKFVTRMGGNFL